MRFDYTKGKEAKYMVTLYSWNVNDRSFFHSFDEAKALFDRLKNSELKDALVSLWDVKKDVRKEYVRL